MTFGICSEKLSKTYFVVVVIYVLERKEIRRILFTNPRPLSRPAKSSVFCQMISIKKVNLYLCHLYDALFEMLNFKKVKNWLSAQCS
ncbi:MAG: hypothetical protein ACTS8H_04020 [Arsenophonus sp. NC-PE1-MAG3]